MSRLAIAPLTKSAFAPFGQVIETEGAEIRVINEGTTERFHDLAVVDVADQAGAPLISIFKAVPRPLPIAITMMERHPLGSQAFVPLTDRPFLIAVAPEAPLVQPDRIEVFLTNGRQGVNYAKNVWHHPVLALEQTSSFLVVDRGGPGDNLEEYYLENDGLFISP